MLRKTNQELGRSGKDSSLLQSKMRSAIGLAAALLLIGGAAQAAGPLSFDFTFPGNNGSTGTVTGEIIGLSDNNSYQPASQVIVDSVTGNPNVSISTPTVFDTNIDPNSAFNVSHGSIQGAYYIATDPTGAYRLSIGLAGGGGHQYNLLVDTLNAQGVQDVNGTGVIYTSVNQVPELPIPLMLSIGMLVPLLARRARKTRQSV
jgi:hypothetical protein